MENTNATQRTGRSDRRGPDGGTTAPSAAARNGAGLGHLADPQRRALEEAANDLGIVIAFENVMQRRGFLTSHDTRRHLEELLKALTEEREERL